MEYRFNFVIHIFIEVAFLSLKFIYVIIVFDTGLVINGFTPDAILMFIGTYTMMTGLYWGLFAPNFMGLSNHINTGSLDLLMLKPVSLQFIVSLKKIDFGLPIPNLIGGISMIAIGWYRLKLPVSLMNIAGFLVLLISGLVITYALFLLVQLLAFKIMRMNAINDISNALWDFNNMPMMIYSQMIQRIGVYMIPIFIISNFPPLFVLGKLSKVEMIWALMAPIILMIILSVY